MENQSGNTQIPDLSQMLSKIMSNPQAAAMLSTLLSGAVPHKEEPIKETESFDFKEQSILPPKPTEDSMREKRKRLLLALKPYLSPERCQAIDRILMITDALSLLQSEKRQ